MFYILALIVLTAGGYISGFLMGTIHGIHKEKENNSFFNTKNVVEIPKPNPEAHRYTPIERDVVEDAINAFKEDFKKERIRR